MCHTLKTLFAGDGFHTVRIATGYWDIPGLALVESEIRTFLQREGTQLHLLIGKDPYIYASQVKNPTLNYPNDFIRKDLDELEMKEEFENAVQLLLDFCTEEENSKIQIRIFKKNEADEKQFLHSKCYIFTGSNDAIGIVGSSNFTKKGLEGNAELNYAETNWHQVTSRDASNPSQKSHLRWFEEKWALAEAWNREFLEEVLKPSSIGKKVSTKKPEPIEPLTPYETYIKYLQTQFGSIVDTSVDDVLKSYLPAKYNPLTYQLDAVKQCFYNMKNHGGFMLADVVGLGKTIVGVLIIKKFLNEAEAHNRAKRVLLILPPAVSSVWTKTIRDFDKDASSPIEPSIDIATTGSIGNIVDDVDTIEVGETFDNELNKDINYGLIMIDESHNFRNSETQKYRALDELISQISQRNDNTPPYIGLLSATPQNNSPRDLRNQIYLFERNRNQCSLPNVPGGNLEKFFNERIKIFDSLRHDSTSPESKAELKRIADEIRQNVLTDVMVRRTRHDIVKRAEYEADARELKFPKVSGPHRLDYKMSERLVQLFSDTVNSILQQSEEAQSIGYYRYTAIMYFTDNANTRRYEKHNLTAQRISEQLAKIMKILLVKRLESSFDAFRESLQNLRDYTDNMLQMLDHDSVFICPDIDVNAAFKKYQSFEDVQEFLRKKIGQKGGNNIEYRSADFKEEYRKHLSDDKEVISQLLERWQKEHNDPKFDRFKVKFETDFFDPSKNNPHQFDKPRLVIFTEAKATQKSLYEYIKELGYLSDDYELKPLSVSAENRNDLQDAIRRNFDANCPPDEQEDRYNVIITTEVLAEGVNLHRANVILNYDTPWNATRLMQRIGRVNRLGSKEDEVHVFNFYPSAQGDALIKLKDNAFAKLQAFHTMFGEDNKVFSEAEELSESELNKMVDGEASPFEPYLRELKEYRLSNPQRYQHICQTELDNLGGKIVGSAADKALLCIGNGKNGMINIAVDDSGNTQTVSLLGAIEQLHCTAADSYEPHYELPADIITHAMNAYTTFTSPMTRHVNYKQNKNEAVAFCLELYRNAQLTDEARTAIKEAKKAADQGNVEIIKALLKLRSQMQQGGSLFGQSYDISTTINATFGTLQVRNTQRTGAEAKVLIFRR